MALNSVNLYRIDGSLGSLNNIQTSALNGGAIAGFRNRIINGDMRIAQRGTNFPAATNSVNLDRWQWNKSGAMVCTVSQSTDVPNSTFQSSYKVDVTTADFSISSTEYAIVIQRIEGYDVRDLIGTTFTLSFWVKSPKTGTHCVGFRNESQDRSFIKEYSVAVANAWEYKTITVPGGLITSGGWNWTNGAGLEVSFALATGLTYQTAANSWATGNFLATSNQVNVMDSTANDFFLAGVQLEVGSSATPFERRPIGMELALCQRYFWSSTVQQGDVIATGQALSTSAAGYLVELPVPLRSSTIVAAPNNLYGTQANGTFVLFTTFVGATADNPSKLVISLSGASGLVAGNASFLVAGNTGVDGSLSVSAEF